MLADRAMIGLHGVAAALALVAALGWPRTGEAAVMVPFGGHDLIAALHWADREGAQLVTIDTVSGRIVARAPSHRSLVNALSAGIVPIAVGSSGCQPNRRKVTP